MRLIDYQLIFVAAGLIGVLLIASPALDNVIHGPNGEQYSELYLLGPNNMADNYPFDIAVGQNNSVYVNVGNQMGSSVYYMIELKFRNETDSSPNSTLGTPSSLNSLYEYKFVIADGQTWASLLTFSVSNASISGKQSLVSTLMINGMLINVNKPSVWDQNSTLFSYQLLFELWMYNSLSGEFSYNNRFVDLQLNLTSINS